MFVSALQTKIFETSHNLLFFSFRQTSKKNIFGFSVVFPRKIVQIQSLKLNISRTAWPDFNDFGLILEDFEQPLR